MSQRPASPADMVRIEEALTRRIQQFPYSDAGAAARQLLSEGYIDIDWAAGYVNQPKNIGMEGTDARTED